MTPLCRLDQLADGGMRRIDVAGHPILLCRSGERIHAIDDTCPHEDVSLSLGAFDGATVRCPLHGSRFCVRSGRVLDPPATRDVTTRAVTVVDGTIMLTAGVDY